MPLHTLFSAPLIQKLCDDMDEPLEVREYERLNPLLAEKTCVQNFSTVQPGDCIVGFSRRNLFQFKKQIEEALDFKHRVCIVYGGLPPETRKLQARLFNDPNNNYNILVASDAIGMGGYFNIWVKRTRFNDVELWVLVVLVRILFTSGLNLNIRRIIFSTNKKYDGTQTRLLKPKEVQQIAGESMSQS